MQLASLDDQAQPVVAGEVREILGAEGRERQIVGQGACGDPGAVGCLGRSRWIAAAEIRPQVLATSSLLGRTITPSSQFSNASRFRRPPLPELGPLAQFPERDERDARLRSDEAVKTGGGYQE